jgi:hypothetical protein
MKEKQLLQEIQNKPEKITTFITNFKEHGFSR